MNKLCEIFDLLSHKSKFKMRGVFLLAGLVFFASCGNDQQVTHTEKTDLIPALDVVSSDNKSILNFYSPIVIDTASTIAFPLTMKEDNLEVKVLGNTNTPRSQPVFWNILFYNPHTETIHLLDSTKRMNIYQVKPSSNMHAVNKIYYLISVNDMNEDGKLDNTDPKYLYSTDRFGNGLKQITPNDVSVSSWMELENHNLLINIIRDNNNDKRFNESDAVVPVIFRNDTTNQIVSIFKDSIITDLKKRLEKR